MPIETLPAFLNIETFVWFVKLIIVSISLLFSLLVLRHLIDLQDNYRSKVYLLFLALNSILIFYSLTLFLAIFSQIL